jgi:HEAT repeat protein/sugar phosphate permease
MNASTDSLPGPGLEPTNLQKYRTIPWALGFTVLNTFFIQFTFFGSVFVLFLDRLALDKTQIGFILAMLPFFDLISLFLATTVSRRGYRRTFLLFWMVRTMFAVGLLAIPSIAARYGQQAVLIYIAAVVIAFSASRSVAITAWAPWQQEYVPRTIWGRFSAANNIAASLAGVVAVTIAGYVVGLWTDLTGFMVLFAAAILFAAASVFSASHFPGGQGLSGEVVRAQPLGTIRQALRDRRLVSFLIGAGLVSLSLGPLGAFVPLFMQDVVGLSTSNVVLLQTGFLVGGVLFGFLWGWAADRYGSRPVMLTGVTFIVLLPVLWMLMPRMSLWSFPIAMGIAVLRGGLVLSWTIGSARMLYAHVVPPEVKVPYLAIYTAAMGISAGLSQLAGGWLLDLTAGMNLQIWRLRVDNYIVLFIFSMCTAAIALFFLSKVRADSRVSLGQFAGLFVQGNPLMAMESLIRFQLARDETATVNVTERLGRSGSPLTVEELLQALQDPRFYVRFEAIVSIARRPADPRLLDALADVLRGNDPSLSVIAAWALGRIGDPRAAQPLRAALDSPYRSIRAHAARSLGSLEDESAAPVLLERLPLEPDHGLRVAYAAALGRLRVPEALPHLLPLLREEQEPEANLELTLALARLLGDENWFVHSWRHLRDDPGTTLSQALMAFRRQLPLDGLSPELADQLDAALEAFARQDLDSGAQALENLLASLPPEHYDPYAWVVLEECRQQINAHGPGRPEYLLLALEAASQGWHADLLPGFDQPDGPRLA